MNEIEVIRARHSVRAYQEKKIEQEKIDKLKELIEKVNQEGDLHLQYVEDAGNTFKRLLSRFMGLASAPSIIACIGKDDESLEERIGFYGEKVVLAAQSMGLNTCWAGTFSKNHVPAEVRDGERLCIVIAVGYGENPGRVRRSKRMEQVSQAVGKRPYWFDFGVEMALLAPTAINQQNFLIRLNCDETVEFVDKGGPFSKVDLGIVRCHFEIGAEYAKENDL